METSKYKTGFSAQEWRDAMTNGTLQLLKCLLEKNTGHDWVIQDAISTLSTQWEKYKEELKEEQN